MPTKTLTIFNPLPLEDILPEERLELALPDIGYPEHLVVIPWRSLRRANKLFLLDELPREFCRATILKFEWEDQEIQWWTKHLGFKKIFCTSTNKAWPFVNLSYPDYISDRIVSSPNKDIPFSFVGWKNNILRQVIFERYKDVPSVIRRDEYGYSVDYSRNKAYAEQYISILSRSRFSLCPRGVGNGTKRIWESLQAGAIPIIISDTLELPKCWNWNETVIFVKEWQIIENSNKIPVLMTLPKGMEDRLRNNCYKAAAAFTDPHFVAHYLKHN